MFLFVNMAMEMVMKIRPMAVAIDDRFGALGSLSHPMLIRRNVVQRLAQETNDAVNRHQAEGSQVSRAGSHGRWRMVRTCAVLKPQLKLAAKACRVKAFAASVSKLFQTRRIPTSKNHSLLDE
jgi:hypothetical protein